MAAASGQHLLRVAPERLGGREREHRPDPLAAGQQRVPHRLLEPAVRAPGRSAAARGNASTRCCSSTGYAGASTGQSRRSWPSEPVGRATARVELRSEPSGELGAALDELGGLVGAELAGAQPAGHVLELAGQIVERLGPVTPDRPPPRDATAARMPLTKPGASAEQSSFAASTASSMATSAGTSGQDGGARASATRRMLRSSGAIRSSVQPSAWRAISASSSGRSRSTRLHELTRERPGVAVEQLVEAGRPVTSAW